MGFLQHTRLLGRIQPEGVQRQRPLALPHLGPEGLAVVDAEHIVVVNDNNFPFSSGRTLGQPDANELTLLNIRALLDAR